MPQGDKAKYTAAQKRKAAHIEESYEDRGVPAKEAEARAWATVNKQDGGGRKGGSGEDDPHGNRAARSEAARRGWETRRKRHS